MKGYRRTIFFCTILLWLTSFSYCENANEPKYLLSLPTDNIGHHQIFFSPLFPFYQPDFIVNGIIVDGAIGASNGSFIIDEPHFANPLDTNNIISGKSWFNYRQGDYLYKRIIIGREYIPHNHAKILFKGNAHTFPGPYGNLKPLDVYDGYSNNATSLQNYSLKYQFNDSLTTSADFGFLYHLEDSGLPFSIDGHHFQFHESFHTGMNWRKNYSNSSYQIELNYQYGKLDNDHNNIEYLTIWNNVNFDYSLSNAFKLGVEFFSKTGNRESSDSLIIFENGWNNVLIHSNMTWNHFQNSFGINKIQDDYYPNVSINVHQNNYLLSGHHFTKKYYILSDKKYSNVTKNQLQLVIYDCVVNSNYSVILLGELNKLNENKYHAGMASIKVNNDQTQMRLDGYIVHSKKEINLKLLRGNLTFMPVIASKYLQFLAEVPLVGMIFWNEQKRYFPFFTVNGWYFNNSNYELPIFDIWQGSVEYSIPHNFQLWANIQFGFTTENFKFTWSINNLSNAHVQMTNFTQPLSSFSFFQVDWRFFN